MAFYICSYMMNRVFQKTKVIATVGPACNTYEKLLKLVTSGVDVFRLNFSHGTHDEHKIIIDYIRKINENYPYKIAILGDLQGPKLRVGEIENNGVELIPGQSIIFTNAKIIGNAQKVYISYKNFYNDVKVGERILLDDGKLELEVEQKNDDASVKLKILQGGILSSKKGINLPETNVSIPAITEKDKEDIMFAVKERIDWLALSFVRRKEDILELKEILLAQNAKTKVISKIEKPEALNNLRDIIVSSDGIMIARGDLGIELPLERIPMIQKEIVRKCLHRAKPVIIATQMMESMMERSKPNRSEITDVANAVLEGADAVMLSGETAIGKHPALVIQTMTKIIGEVEKEDSIYHRDVAPQPHSPSFLSDAMCYATSRLAVDVNADALIGSTQSGYTAFMLSSFRPRAPLFIFTKTQSLVHQLSLSWGVRAFYYPQAEELDTIISDQINFLKDKKIVRIGDVVVSTGSTPVAEQLPTNLIKITKVK